MNGGLSQQIVQTGLNIFTGKYHPGTATLLDKGRLHVTIRNDLRLQKSHAKCDLQKSSLTNSVANIHGTFYLNESYLL